MVFSPWLGVPCRASTGPVENFQLERGAMLEQIGAPVQKLCKTYGGFNLLQSRVLRWLRRNTLRIPYKAWGFAAGAGPFSAGAAASGPRLVSSPTCKRAPVRR